MTRKSAASGRAAGGCACGAVRLEIDLPAFWAWHDHSKQSRHAQACAYVTYVGVWKSRFRLLKGLRSIRRFADARGVRSFCANCGTPLLFERAHAPRMVNIPRALFESGVGREPRYHIALEDSPEWAWRGESVVPLKGYPGVMWNRSKRRRQTVPVF